MVYFYLINKLKTHAIHEPKYALVGCTLFIPQFQKLLIQSVATDIDGVALL